MAMKLTRLAALALLVLVTSCTGPAMGLAPLGYTVQGSTGIPSPYALERLKAATYLVLTDQGSGSGVAFYDSGLSTYILTAAHVVDHLPIGGKVELLGVTIEGGHRRYDAYLHKIGDKENIDLAILSTQAGITDLIAIDDRMLSHEAGTPVLAIGCPARIFPPVLSIGYLTVNNPLFLSHTAGVWFGSSGGPLVALDSLRLIGINVRIGRCHEGGPHSDHVLAMRLELLRSFVGDLK